MNKILIPFIILASCLLYSLFWNQYRKPYCAAEEIIIEESIDSLDLIVEEEVVPLPEVVEETTEIVIEESALFEPLDVYFEFASTNIVRTPRLEAWLRNAKKYMEENPGTQLSIVGHTDNIGSAASNQNYSERRAESLKQILIAEGFNANNLAPSGKGETEPIASNDTEEGRALNRRASIRLIR